MLWYIRYNGTVARNSVTRQKLTVESDSIDEALAMARRKLVMKNPRLVEVFNHQAPPPLDAGDEGRRELMALGY